MKMNFCLAKDKSKTGRIETGEKGEEPAFLMLLYGRKWS
jgi:hypothetical protein